MRHFRELCLIKVISVSLFQGDSEIPGKDGTTGDPVSLMMLSCKELFFIIIIIIHQRQTMSCLYNAMINATFITACYCLYKCYYDEIES